MLLFSNLPHNCSEVELRKSMESRGVRPDSVRIILDTVSGISPAFGEVELQREASAARALASLQGMLVRNRIVQVRQTACFRDADTVALPSRSPLSKHVSRAVSR